MNILYLYYSFVIFFNILFLKGENKANDLLYLNILYVWYERVFLTQKYIEESKEILNNIDLMNILLIERMRNPSIHLYQKQSLLEDISFFDSKIKKLNEVYDAYVELTEYGKTYLEKNNQDAINIIKKKCLEDILKKLLTLKNIFSFCQNFYIESKVDSKVLISEEVTKFIFNSSFFIDIFLNASYYKKLYVDIDLLFIKIYKSIYKTKKLIGHYQQEFWKIVQGPFLYILKDEYNQKALIYKQKYGSIEKIIIKENNINVTNIALPFEIT